MIEWTRVRLTQWGRWCQGQRRTGYPTASAFVHANEGDRCKHDGADMPTDIQEVEDCVLRCSSELARVVQQQYIKRTPRWMKAMQLGISVEDFKRRLWIAEAQIDRMLASLDGAAPKKIQQGGTRSRASRSAA